MSISGLPFYRIPHDELEEMRDALRKEAPLLALVFHPRRVDAIMVWGGIPYPAGNPDAQGQQLGYNLDNIVHILCALEHAVPARRCAAVIRKARDIVSQRIMNQPSQNVTPAGPEHG